MIFPEARALRNPSAVFPHARDPQDFGGSSRHRHPANCRKAILAFHHDHCIRYTNVRRHQARISERSGSTRELDGVSWIARRQDEFAVLAERRLRARCQLDAGHRPPPVVITSPSKRPFPGVPIAGRLGHHLEK